MTWKALMFDVFGTVVDWRTTVARELRGALAPHGIDRDWNVLADGWRELYQPAMERVRSGGRGFAILDELHRENLDELLEREGIHALDGDGRARLNLCWHRLDPWPDSPAGLLELGAGRVCASCSNGNIALMVNLSRHGKLRWDAILGAELTRAYKPDPACYLGSAAAIGLEPGEVMMVAAHNGDLKAAGELGFGTAFVRRPTEHGPEQTTDLTPEGDWDLEADDLIDLSRKLS